jgi:hypothetical protein
MGKAIAETVSVGILNQSNKSLNLFFLIQLFINLMDKIKLNIRANDMVRYIKQ